MENFGDVHAFVVVVVIIIIIIIIIIFIDSHSKNTMDK